VYPGLSAIATEILEILLGSSIQNNKWIEPNGTKRPVIDVKFKDDCRPVLVVMRTTGMPSRVVYDGTGLLEFVIVLWFAAERGNARNGNPVLIGR
jgi:hypothetical protein